MSYVVLKNPLIMRLYGLSLLNKHAKLHREHEESAKVNIPFSSCFCGSRFKKVFSITLFLRSLQQ